MTEQISPFDEWYALSESLVPFIGERACSLFAHAVFEECGDGATAAYFRTQLTTAGTDVDHPHVTETEGLLIDWGRQVVRDAAGLGPDWRARFEAAFTPSLRSQLVRFAALSIATAVVHQLGDADLPQTGRVGGRTP